MFKELLKNHCLILFCICANVSASADDDFVKRAIERHIESSHIKPSELSLVIADAEGKIKFNLNGDKKFSPASVTKIATAAAILDKMPVGYQFSTQLMADTALIKGNVLNGDIYLHGGGDAGFVSESMWYLVNEFYRSGIREISGDIIVDDSRFDRVRFDPSRDQERVDRAYDAPIGAMTFNWSAVNIFVRPGAKPKDPAVVFVDPKNDYIKLENRAKTAEYNKKNSLVITSRPMKKDEGSKNIKVKSDFETALEAKEMISVAGEISAGRPEFVAYKSISEPDIWAGYNLKEFFNQRGITVSGNVKSGITAKSAKVMAEFKSHAIGELVSSMMKFSNNYIAEILTKNLGAENISIPGTMEKGLTVISKYLNEIGITDFQLLNPSGLTRRNQFRAKDFIHLLTNIKSNFRIFPEYISSLPIAGVDGTLKKHVGLGEYAGQIRAKTGHLTGVASLAGYVSVPNQEINSFVFLYNGNVDGAYKSRELYDKILVEIIKNH